MAHDSALNETSLAQECLRHLGEDKNVLHRAAHVLELVAHSSVGLGEVLQDFAHQAWGQLNEVIRASRNVANGTHTTEDTEVLRNVHMIMKSIKVVLDRTPGAMLHNKAETLGAKEKITRADVMRIAHEFARWPDMERLLASEDAGVNLLASLKTVEKEEPLISPAYTGDIFEARRH